MSRSSGVPVRRSRSDAGKSTITTGGISNVPTRARQNGVAGNCSVHHFRHRKRVWRLTPTSSCRRRIRAGLAPQRIAEIRTTMAPR